MFLFFQTLAFWILAFPINLLNPKIKIWILICCPYSLPIEVVGRNWEKNQANSSCVIIMSVISMTTPFALILQWEIWCWSLLGLKGLENGIQCFGSSKQRSSAFWLFKHWNSVFCLSNKLWVLFFFNMGSFILWLFQTLEFSVFLIQCFCFFKPWNSGF